MRGNLAFLHIRNYRCAFVVCVKLRWLLGCVRNLERVRWSFWRVRLSGVVVRWCGRLFGGRSSFPLFGELGGFWGIVETSVLRFVYIFRSVGGVLSVWEHRAVGGSSDGGVKGIPLNNTRFG